MAIKIDGQDLLKRYINGQEIVRVYKNRGEIRPNTVPPTPPVFDNYLCFTANTSGSKVTLVKNGNPTGTIIQISYDKSTWTRYYTDNYTTITLNNIGDKVYFRTSYSEPHGFSKSGSSYYHFLFQGSISASGDVTSLLCKNGSSSLVGNRCFQSLFLNATALTTAPELPATTLTQGGYTDMFRGCTSLTTVPELPATSLPYKCYYGMFGNCTSLNQLPSLPATILEESCCAGMFTGCTNLGLYTQQDVTHPNEYRIPTSGTATAGTDALLNMFRQAGGEISTPSINTTYYTSNTIV